MNIWVRVKIDCRAVYGDYRYVCRLAKERGLGV